MGRKPWAKALRLISRNALAYGLARLMIDAQISFEPKRLPPKKVAGTLRRAVRSRAFAKIPGGWHMECAYYFDFCRLCQSGYNRLLDEQRANGPRVPAAARASGRWFVRQFATRSQNRFKITIFVKLIVSACI